MQRPLGSIVGGLLYGVWTFAIHISYGLPMALKSGTAQFLLSAGLTFVGVKVMTALFNLLQPPQLAACLACVGSLITTYGLIIGVHLLIGTPRIVMTLLPGIIPTVGLSILYAGILYRHGTQQLADGAAAN